ncbi:rab11 family-interacting protein 3-like [Octodon degus]|uniref:Rab11 family-interacting protein 3-like n=1 Tax=Octodon degus TaxID=10160 RepID=A0A6P6E538_OCTDE|nr:rab11 family-interacting protein 3-like [Octodon degus]
MEPGWPPSPPGPAESARGDALPDARPAEPEDCAPCRRGLPPGASHTDGERLLASHGLPSDPSQAPPLSGDPAAGTEDGARLRAVFDALDGDGDGFVRIEDFVQFATVYGAEQIGKEMSRVSHDTCRL